MAKKSNFKKIESIKDTKDGGFGTYKEENGGGTPRGGIWGGQNGRIGWNERIKSGDTPSSAHREGQPRTEDGKFTYNSVNGKETKYESRGETVNPLLTGGENGIKISEAEKQFAAKSGNLYDKYKDTWYTRGSEKVAKEGKKYKIKLSKYAIWEIARVSFDIKKGAFTYEDENFEESKVGRHSAAEKAAIKEAKTNKGETFVKDSGTGGIATKKGMAPIEKPSTGIQFRLPTGKIMQFKKLQQAVAQGSTSANMPAANRAPTQSSVGVTSSGQVASPGTLKGIQKTTMALNPNVLKKIAGAIVGKTAPTPAPTRKVSLSGFGKR